MCEPTDRKVDDGLDENVGLMGVDTGEGVCERGRGRGLAMETRRRMGHSRGVLDVCRGTSASRADVRCDCEQ